MLKRGQLILGQGQSHYYKYIIISLLLLLGGIAESYGNMCLLRYMLPKHGLTICMLSVTLVHPAKAVGRWTE